MSAKNAGDWPMKSPMSVRNLTTPLAMPLVSVGRMTEHGGSLRLMKRTWLRHDQVSLKILSAKGSPNCAAQA